MKTIVFAGTLWVLAAVACCDQTIAAEGLLTVKADEPIVYVPKAGTITRWRFLTIRYRGEPSTEGFFLVEGKPTRMQIASSKPDLLQIDLLGMKSTSTGAIVSEPLGEEYTFSKAGDVSVTVTVGNESKTIPVKIVVLPITVDMATRGTTSAEVIQTYGMPDNKLKVFVSWPDLKRIDGIIYKPEAGNAAIAEHWRYNALPGLVISIMNGVVYRIASNTNQEMRAKAEADAARLADDKARFADRQAAEEAKFRIWRDKAGGDAQAKFVKLENSVVTLESKRGKQVQLRLTELIEEDQKWIREELKKAKGFLGKHTITGGVRIGWLSLDDFDEFWKCVFAGNREAYEKLIDEGWPTGKCAGFEMGGTVYVTEVSTASSAIKVRREGESKEYWIAVECIQ